MPNTGERGEISGCRNAKEAEVIQQWKKLASKTKQLLARMEAKNRLRSAQALKGAALRSAANELTPVPRVRIPPPPPRSLEGGDLAAISRILLTHRTGESVPLFLSGKL
jgi:hypothetical protein